MKPIWKPNTTVAAVIERDGRFLMVEEQTEDGVRLNQPAGHLDDGESLVAACRRETQEETAWDFTPQHLVGIYQWRRPPGDVTYLRFAFCGTLGTHDSKRPLDTGIHRALWMDMGEIISSQAIHRSPLVLQCINDYLAKHRFPLDLIRHYES